jgi:hypothetical protein
MGKFLLERVVLPTTSPWKLVVFKVTLVLIPTISLPSLE